MCVPRALYDKVMPELPEVETIRQDLARVLREKGVVRVAVCKAKLVRGGRPASFARRLRGKRIRTVRRRGKLLIFVLDDPDLFLLIHLKMTGQLIFRGKRRFIGGGHGYPLVGREELPNKYTHIIFYFADGGVLFFNDMRQFGYVQLVDEQALARVERAYGVEPLSPAFTPAALRAVLAGRGAALKSVLLDQRWIAGLGNIYADEACFLAHLRPTRRAKSVTRAEAVRLHRAIRRVLQAAIRLRGTTFGSYRDGFGGAGAFVSRLAVYGQAGQPCRRCGTTLRRVVVGGRGTVYCPACQR